MAVALEKPCYLAPRSPLLAPMAVAQGLGPALLEMSPLLAPMAVAQGLAPALVGPWCPCVVELILMPPQFAPMAVPHAAPCPKPPLVLVLVRWNPLMYLAPTSPQPAPMAVALEEFWYLALMPPLLAPMAVAQGLAPALSDPWCPYVVVLVLMPPQFCRVLVEYPHPPPRGS